MGNIVFQVDIFLSLQSSYGPVEEEVWSTEKAVCPLLSMMYTAVESEICSHGVQGLSFS